MTYASGVQITQSVGLGEPPGSYVDVFTANATF